jgi:DNA-binding HxlR family transcriptional regulator
MKTTFRCNCPVTTFIDLFGDRWMLIILKQMLLEDKETFKEFAESDEAIATNILSDRLKRLEQHHLIIKSTRPDNRKSHRYLLTEKGLTLAPIIVDMALWSLHHLADDNPTMQNLLEAQQILANKDAFMEQIRQNYLQKHPA